MIESHIRQRVDENDTNQETLHAAVYARTSSTTREYGYSLDAQVKRCLDRARSLGWEVVFIYRDGAESGKDTDRPMFQKMLSRAEMGLFDVIVFWKLDRFSRSLMHAVKLEDELRDHDVNLYSVTEQIDTTSATGRFNFRNIASAAEFERDMIRERAALGLNQMAKDHKWPNGNPPLGYDTTSEGKLSVNSEEEALVRRIFDMYTEVRSMPSVAETLNEEGISTSEGSEWNRRAVGDVLRNELYRGAYHVGDISEHVPEYQIIPDEIFEEVSSIRMRFRETDQTREAMPDTRKNRMIRSIKQSYDEYLDSCR